MLLNSKIIYSGGANTFSPWLVPKAMYCTPSVEVWFYHVMVRSITRGRGRGSCWEGRRLPARKQCAGIQVRGEALVPDRRLNRPQVLVTEAKIDRIRIVWHLQSLIRLNQWRISFTKIDQYQKALRLFGHTVDHPLPRAGVITRVCGVANVFAGLWWGYELEIPNLAHWTRIGRAVRYHEQSLHVRNTSQTKEIERNYGTYATSTTVLPIISGRRF